jgi:4-nitrophenyl phosphatase
MISLLHPLIRGLILDMDGVLWQGNEPIGNLRAIFSQINRLGLTTVFTTNNSSLSPTSYKKKLAGFGVKVQADQIITSATAVAMYLKENFAPSSAVYVIGEEGLRQSIREAGFNISSKGACAVIVGLDRELSFEKLREATLLIRAGAVFIGTNPDRTYPSPEGLTPGAGSIIAAIEAATDIQPVILGKPYPHLLELSVERLNLPQDQILLVGDRLETDIAGGQNAGLKTALVLTGVSTLQDVDKWYPKPDIITPSLDSLLGIE